MRLEQAAGRVQVMHLDEAVLPGLDRLTDREPVAVIERQRGLGLGCDGRIGPHRAAGAETAVGGRLRARALHHRRREEHDHVMAAGRHVRCPALDRELGRVRRLEVVAERDLVAGIERNIGGRDPERRHGRWATVRRHRGVNIAAAANATVGRVSRQSGGATTTGGEYGREREDRAAHGHL